MPDLNVGARLVLSALLLTLASLRGLPVFRCYCGAAALLTALYLPYNTPWLRAYYPAISCALVLGRVALAAESLYWLYDSRKDRVTAFASAGLAIGVVIAGWSYQGIGIAPWVELRNYIQIGTVLVLLLPLLVSWRFSAGDLWHGWVTLVYLGGFAGVSLTSTAWLRFGSWWPYVDLVGYAVSIGCCVAWLIRASRASSFDKPLKAGNAVAHSS